MRSKTQLTLRRAVMLVGLPGDFKLRNEDDAKIALAHWKSATVEARRAGDDNRAAELSQAKEVFKLRINHSAIRRCACGGVKAALSVRCRICAWRERYYKNILPQRRAA